jgi:dephospho-CoA kinase
MKIALTGWAGSGKTDVARYFRLNYDCEIVSFADGIKYIDSYLFGSGKKDRSRLQKIGEFFRTFNENIWVNRTLETIQNEQRVAVDDLRRINEYDALVKEGFKIIRIVADEDIRVERLIARDGFCDTSLLYNETESGCSNLILPEIENNGSLEELYEKIEEWVLSEKTNIY